MQYMQSNTQTQRTKKMEMEKKIVGIVCIIAMSMSMGCNATLQQDEQECAEQLTNLASCIPFVSGSAPKPTPQCCQQTQQVKATHPKCLCVLIKESTDPSMGLPVNTTLALQMPSACHIDADVSNCPSILKIAADSPDAKIFKAASSSSSAPTDSPSSSTPTSGSSGSKAASSSTSNGVKRNNVFDGSILFLFGLCISIFFI